MTDTKHTAPPAEGPEDRLDALFLEAFPTNHPAMLDYASLKIELKRLRAESAELEAMLAEAEGIELWGGTTIFQYQSRGKWSHDKDMGPVFDTPLDAYRALKEQTK